MVQRAEFCGFLPSNKMLYDVGNAIKGFFRFHCSFICRYRNIVGSILCVYISLIAIRLVVNSYWLLGWIVDIFCEFGYDMSRMILLPSFSRCFLEIAQYCYWIEDYALRYDAWSSALSVLMGIQSSLLTFVVLV